MNAEMLNLILRIFLLSFLAVMSEMAYYKKDYSLMVFSFGVWLTVFRLAMLRAIALYIGVFGKPSEYAFSKDLLDFLSSGSVANISTTISIVGSLLMIKKLYKNKKGVRNYGFKTI